MKQNSLFLMCFSRATFFQSDNGFSFGNIFIRQFTEFFWKKILIHIVFSKKKQIGESQEVFVHSPT